ncbi:GNAT family N-acetyltransferase [Deinococcus gobiensis]|uniref:Histone acetyltransferase HPA10 n=1 Tax=Deinococcus gobiensis (strain DSM 21396 / JCM 16679 / CGMCC 1.7299 / I-0) TaxID=745776 RepID=H8H2M1_DEIGI|nr:GNAT family N-acetyltransferase [Deinococcus gobiensis]AFD27768.1 Histone acetyltransferase HPA10 [Deinococcus gobiensis I-0]
MLSLHPMTPESFQRFLQRSVATYAAENVRSGRWTAEEAQERSAADFQTLLPEGSATPHNFCFDLHDADRHQDVGVLWYKLMQRGGQKIAFVYEIEVGAEHRRRGYAREAFWLLEQHAAERGATAVQLHVFGHNHPARALYEGLGFEPVSITMQRELKPIH